MLQLPELFLGISCIWSDQLSDDECLGRNQSRRRRMCVRWDVVSRCRSRRWIVVEDEVWRGDNILGNVSILT